MVNQENLYHGGIEVMVWGMIGSDSALEMVEVTGHMNADDYIIILKSKVTKKRIFKYGSIFQQDNAPCHNAKRVMELLDEKNI